MNAMRLAVVPLIAAGFTAAACTSTPREGASASASPSASVPAVQPSATPAAAGGGAT